MRIAETAVLVTLATVISIVEPHLDVVFGITGCITGFLLAWALPASVTLAMHPDAKAPSAWVPWLLLVLGALGTTVGTALYIIVYVLKQ